MSHGTTQEKAAMTLELRDIQQERQRQLAADLRRAEELRLQTEQAKQLELTQQREVSRQPEQQRSRGVGLGL